MLDDPVLYRMHSPVLYAMQFVSGEIGAKVAPLITVPGPTGDDDPGPIALVLPRFCPDPDGPICALAIAIAMQTIITSVSKNFIGSNSRPMLRSYSRR
jgi:hypothetical protein